MNIELEEKQITKLLFTQHDVVRLERAMLTLELKLSEKISANKEELKAELIKNKEESNGKFEELRLEIIKNKEEANGKFEQIYKEIINLHKEIIKNKEETNEKFEQSRLESRQQFRWVMGSIVVTLIVFVLTTLLTN